MSDSSTVFDADALATTPPAIRIGERVFVGRVLSIVEWTVFLERFLSTTETELKELGKQGVLRRETMLQSHAFCVEYLRAALPPRRIRLRMVDPVALLEAQGSRMLKQAFAHFFGHQCYVMGVALRTPTDAAMSAMTEAPKSAAGMSSSDSTARAPSDAGAPS